MTVALVANIARPISSAISTAFSADSYGLLSSYGLLGASANPDAVIEALFANNEVGVFYDPSDLSTMFQDSAGTTQVTADGQPVGKILDKSGRGNHASQATAASRPLYKTDGTYHWLQFDGVDDSLSTAAIDFTSTDKMSVFSGIRKVSSVLSYSVLTEFDQDSYVMPGTFGIFANTSAANQLDFSARGSDGAYASIKASPFVSPITLVCTSLINLSAASLALSVIPRVNTVVTQTALEGPITLGGVFASKALFIGRRNNASLPYTGNIYSLIVRGALSTTQEITDTETWVNSKCGAF